MNALVFLVLLIFMILMIGFFILYRKSTKLEIRDIRAFYRLRGAVERAVEDGSRIHLAIGHGDLTTPQAAAALVGLSMLQRIAVVASESDQPPVTTAGDGTWAILAQDTLRSAYDAQGLSANYNNRLGRVTGVTPFSYAAGVMPLIFDESVATNLMLGSFGSEVALITSAAERSQTLTLAGTDNLTGQAVLYAAAHEPIIGEEIYASGAYMGAGAAHLASLKTQDVIRWISVILILGSAIFGLIQGLF